MNAKWIRIALVVALAAYGGACRRGADAPPAAAAVVLTDAAGRTVQLAHIPQRISITGKASFTIENAIYLFPEARQKGLDFQGSRYAQRSDAGDFLSLIMPERAAPSPLGGEAGLEQLAASHPDVVLMKAAGTRTGDALDSLGIPVIFLDLETPAHYERDLGILGQVLDATNRANELIAYYQGILATVRERTAALSSEEKPRTLLLQYADRGGTVAFSVPPPDWIQTEMVEAAGGIPVWKDAARRGGWTLVHLEQIAAWNPAVVLVARYRGPATAAVESIKANPQWQALRAAQTERIYAFPGDFSSWDQPDPRWSLGLLWLATRLHPERFADVDLRAEIVRFYAWYGLDEASVRAHVFPLLTEGVVNVGP